MGYTNLIWLFGGMALFLIVVAIAVRVGPERT
jgi:hypothetical protein